MLYCFSESFAHESNKDIQRWLRCDSQKRRRMAYKVLNDRSAHSQCLWRGNGWLDFQACQVNQSMNEDLYSAPSRSKRTNCPMLNPAGVHTSRRKSKLFNKNVGRRTRLTQPQLNSLTWVNNIIANTIIIYEKSKTCLFAKGTSLQ